MKVLYLTKYSRNGASSRLRSYQFVPFLQAEGITVTLSPFFDEAYLINLYCGKSTSKSKLIKFYLKRFFRLFSIYKYDRIVIEKELFPYFFSWFEKILWMLQVKYIVDYDDAIFHNYDLSTNKLISFLLKNKINYVMQYSSCVIAGNSYLAKRAKVSGAKKIVLLPTVINLDLYTTPNKNTSSKIVIGWIGSPSTFKYVKNYSSVFAQLLKNPNVELHIIGATEDLGLGKSVKYLKWTEDSEVSLISQFDIGIMPLENTLWELGKCSYKLIQYMGCGIPVVASAIGMNTEVIQNGENGFLVSTEKEWIDSISQLIEDKNLRVSLGQNGKKKVENKYTTHINYKKLISILSNEN